MATAALVGGALLGDAVSKLSSAIIRVLKKTSQFKPKLLRLQETITKKKPIFDEIEKLFDVLDRKEEKETLVAQMRAAEALVLECESIKRNYYKKYTHASKLDALNASLQNFCQFDLQLSNTRGILELLEAIRMMVGDAGSWSSGAPLLKGVVIGFEDQVRGLKAMVLKDSDGGDCSVVVVSAAGGCGKTTLVKTLCQDPAILENFGRNIYFSTISETPNLKIVIRNLLPKQAGQTLDFNNDEDAINKWGSFLGGNKSEKLLVLDDVWCDSIINLFKCNLRGYKILATSRFTYKQFNTYQLQPLNHNDATTLFCLSAFSESGTEDNDIPDDLVDKLVKCCKQHPLALGVIGGLVKGKDEASWRAMLKKLSDGQKSVLDLDKSIPLCLARSLNFFEEESVMKQSYLDLGLFPEDQKMAATMLMDMWVHLYNHDEEGLDTRDHLFDLSYKNLATLFPTRKHSPEVDNYCEEYSVTQHDLLRTLSISLSSQGAIEDRKRLIINVKGQDLPQLPPTVNARLLSISTGESFSLKWNHIEAPKVEICVLNLMSKIYPLPQFMKTMERLKVLIITNYGYHFSELQNFPPPLSLSSLTTIRLDHVLISSPVSTRILELAHLKKLSLIMCKISNLFSDYIPYDLPSLLELHIDSCEDFITYPATLCNIFRLKKLSITNCHELSSISEEFGNLTNLEVLRLASCSKLAALPETIRNLRKLRVIDLTDCLKLHELPAGIGELRRLKKIHMRGCRGLQELPISIKNLLPLEVFCDEEIWRTLWNDNDPTDVKVHLVEEDTYSTFLKIKSEL